jgi:hypothetical protein
VREQLAQRAVERRALAVREHGEDPLLVFDEGGPARRSVKSTSTSARVSS